MTQPTFGMFSPNRTRENGCSFERWIDSYARVAEISAKPSSSASCSADSR